VETYSGLQFIRGFYRSGAACLTNASPAGTLRAGHRDEPEGHLLAAQEGEGSDTEGTAVTFQHWSLHQCLWRAGATACPWCDEFPKGYRNVTGRLGQNAKTLGCVQARVRRQVADGQP